MRPLQWEGHFTVHFPPERLKLYFKRHPQHSDYREIVCLPLLLLGSTEPLNAHSRPRHETEGLRQ